MIVAHQKVRACDRRVVSGLSVECGDTTEFTVPCRDRGDHDNITLHGLNDKQVIDQNHLTVTVPPPLPAALAVPQIEAVQNPVVETVKEAGPLDDVGELGLQAAGLPDGMGRQAPVGHLFDLKQLTADAVAAGQKDPVAGEGDRLRDLLGVGRPRMLPDDEPVFRHVRDQRRVVEDQNLRDAGKDREDG